MISTWRPHTITIRRALVPLGGKVEVSEPKTARGRRRIALDPLTIEALKAHAARQADEQSACEDWNESGYIFTTEDGQPLDPHRISKAFERHLREAALPRIPLHGLRHTYATLASSSGVNPRIVSATAGALDGGPDARHLLPRPAAGRPGGRRSDRGPDRALVEEVAQALRLAVALQLGHAS